MPGTMQDEITFQFPNFNAAVVEVLKCASYPISHFIMAELVMRAGIKINLC